MVRMLGRIFGPGKYLVKMENLNIIPRKIIIRGDKKMGGIRTI
jgi:hypothetical protein